MNYEASGWVVHQVSDIWAKTSPDRGQAVWALWLMGGAWLCTHLWEHYTYKMDKVSSCFNHKMFMANKGMMFVHYERGHYTASSHTVFELTKVMQVLWHLKYYRKKHVQTCQSEICPISEVLGTQ